MIWILAAKDPNDVKYYSCDFTSEGFLEPSEVIVDAAVSIDGPDDSLTCSSPPINFNGVITTIVSGGTPGANYFLHFDITTNLRGQQDRKSGQILVLNL